ncbi:DUF1987 domain-containing protein [Holophaga foetida]|uniref:DUF1987 domain-containing protein n=1 Tax=Holophaga foetida TaxID=35839 RepID=UPI000247216F|nr:DUF1987 domain-containing protein [Holophaga foetida]
MRTYHSPATPMTPEVTLSGKDARLSIAGECYPENPLRFFAPLFEALNDVFEAHNPARFSACIHLKYINSASTKAFRQIFKLLDAAAAKGVGVEVEWVFDPEDDALQELGMDLAEDMCFLDYRECPLESVA